MPDPTTVTTVNAWSDDERERVTVSFRGEDGEWRQFSLSQSDAVTVADMLRLITRTTD